MSKNVIIIGAGPAGLTAGFELLEYDPGLRVTILEADQQVGGIAGTVERNGMRLDIGGHRYLTTDLRVDAWWRAVCGDELMLVDRHSDILYQNRFYHYPLVLNLKMLRDLGAAESVRILFSYFAARMNKREESSLRNLYINRFGTRLYRMFFADYTKKVLGRDASEVSADWGRLRVGGVSVSRALLDGMRRCFRLKAKRTEASLTDVFFYPKSGSGEMWEKAAEAVQKKGGQILTGKKVKHIAAEGNRVTSVRCVDGSVYDADIVISSMPLRDLIAGLPSAPAEVRKTAQQLSYRSVVVVGVQLMKSDVVNTKLLRADGALIPDQWIYIQDKRVRLGRTQIADNWSSAMNPTPDTVCLGLEYFCSADDPEWSDSESDWIRNAMEELKSIGLAGERATPLHSLVVCCEKAYPCYWGGYYDLDTIRRYLDEFMNLYCIGRNGRHQYCNMDAAMLSAFQCVNDIAETYSNS